MRGLPGVSVQLQKASASSRRRGRCGCWGRPAFGRPCASGHVTPCALQAQGGGMPAVSFNDVLVIGLVAVAVPAICGWWPGLPVPGAVLEVIAGIIVGPSVLGWVHVDAAVQVLSDLGLGMLLILAGLEIDVQRLRE